MIKSLNIVVPMAGRGLRFASAGYKHPKPMIPIGGRPMIQWVIENITPTRKHRFIFICLAEHLELYPEVTAKIVELCPTAIIVPINCVTEGAACTVLLAKDYIDNDSNLIIANADQYVDISINDYLTACDNPSVDGSIMTFWADDPKWSYCRLSSDGFISEVVEKKVISNDATVGIYNFKRGKDFIRAAENSIKKNIRVNNEFYVAPCYNELIDEGMKFSTIRIGKEGDGMYGLGTPSDLEKFTKIKAVK
jgi:dTDP-glucose pyrophosphorylase